MKTNKYAVTEKAWESASKIVVGIIIAIPLFAILSNVPPKSTSTPPTAADVISLKPITTSAANIWTEVEMIVTAYCARACCCGKYADGITASGKPAEWPLVAAPTRYPFGKMMIIPGYNNDLPVSVEDRGGAIKGNKLDVLFETCDLAKQWGKQTLTVRILEN